jgi:hypothetical protein
MLTIFFLVLTIGFVLEIGSGAITLSSVDKIFNLSNENLNSKLTSYSSLQTINKGSLYNKKKTKFPSQQRTSFSTSAINNEKNDY